MTTDEGAMTQMAQGQVDLAVIIVSYNVRDLLQRCLQSLLAALAVVERQSYILVVDNASQDGSAAMVAVEFPEVGLISLPTNLGFAAGNNVGLRQLLKQEHNPGSFTGSGPMPRPRYVLLLNPDTEVVADALARLVAYLDQHPDVVVVGPQLRYGDGTVQSSRRRLPTVGTLFWESTLLEQWWPGNPWARRYRFEDRPASGEQIVDWLVGAAIMARRSAVERAGLLDEGFFMYSEELEWQQRLMARHADRPAHIAYVPEAVVIHHEGRSSEQNIPRRHLNFNQSKLRYARMRFGAAVSLALRVFLVVTYLVQALVEAGKWLVGHKRPLRAGRVRQYARIAGNLLVITHISR